MSALTSERLDDLASRVIAGTAQEASELAAQPFFEGLMAEVEKKPMKLRRYTGAEFFLRHPEKFRSVVSYLAEGQGPRWIAERVGCSHHTVSAVMDRFPRAVATEKERLSKLCVRGAEAMLELILENPESVPGQARGLVAAQLIDKALLLQGAPTVISEIRHEFTHDDFNALIDGAIEVDTGVRGGNPAQMGSTAAGAEGEPPEAGSDLPSLASKSTDPIATPVAPPNAPPEAPDRGGGGRVAGHPAHPSLGNPSA